MEHDNEVMGTAILFPMLALAGISILALILVAVWVRRRNVPRARASDSTHSRLVTLSQSLEVVFDRIEDGFVSLDRDWKYVFVNRKAGELARRRPADLVGRYMWDEFPENELQSFAMAYRQAMDHGETIQFEGYFPLWDRWFENRVFPHSEGIDIFFTDITIRKKAEAERRESEARLRLAVEAANVGLWFWNTETGEIHFSREWKSQIGYKEDEIPNRFEEWESRVHPDDVAPTLAQIQACREDPTRPYEVEFRLRHRNGSYRWILARGSMLADAGGKMVRMLGCHLDITGRKKSEAALSAGLHRLRSVIDGLGPDTFVGLLSLNGVVLEANRPALEAAGLSTADVIGLPVEETYWFSYSDASKRQIREAVDRAAHGEPSRLELSIRTGDGEFTMIDFSLRPLRDNSGVVQFLVPSANVITSQKLAEKAARESSARLTSVFQQATDGIFVISADNHYLDANPEGLAMLGYSHEELMGRHVSEVLTPRERHRLSIEQPRMMTGEPHRAEWEHLRKDGTTFHGEVTARKLDDDSYMAIIRDQTNRRKNEELVRESERRLRLALEAARMGIFDWNIPVNRIVWSRGHEEIFGFEPGEFGGTYEDFSRRVHPGDLPGINEEVAVCIESRTHFHREFRVVWPDGSVHWVEGFGEFTYDESGRAVRMRGVVLDVTRRKRSERALRRRRKFLELALESARMGVWKWEGATDSITRVFGSGPLSGLPAGVGPVTGDAVRALVHPDDLPAVERNLQSTMETGRNYQAEFRIVLPDESVRWVSARGVVSRLEDGRPVRLIGVDMDVTELRVASEQRERAELQLRRNEVLVALGVLVGGVAHEIRTPLFGITATLDAMEAKLGRNAGHAEYLPLLRSEVGRLEALTRDLLEYGRPVGNRMRTRLVQPVAEAVSMCRAGSVIPIDLRFPPDLSDIMIDPLRISVVFRNILQNALQHSPGRSSVVVAATAIRRRGVPGVECTISDSGPGFREEDRAHIFEPFFSRRAGGTGLGLSIVKRIIEDHGGEIAAENGPDGGAVIRLWLPTAPV